MSGRKIEGTDRSDTLTGTNLPEELRGRDGNDRISGNGGEDRLIGDKGNDTLDAGSGNDRLKGGAGDDLLTGGSGNDRFVFDLRGGDDTVTDFGNGTDRLDFTNFGLANADEVLDHAEQVGADVVFTFDRGETVTLLNVQVATLDSGDFLI